MYHDWLISASLKFPSVKVFEGTRHQLLMDLAEDHADFMALRNTQGHQEFQARYDQIKKELNLSATEICAESWPWIKELNEIAQDMFESWEHSSGHWAVCTKVPKYFGCAMAQGKKIWYACILVAN